MDPLVALLLELGSRAKSAEFLVQQREREIESLKAEIEALKPKEAVASEPTK